MDVEDVEPRNGSRQVAVWTHLHGEQDEEKANLQKKSDCNQATSWRLWTIQRLFVGLVVETPFTHCWCKLIAVVLTNV